MDRNLENIDRWQRMEEREPREEINPEDYPDEDDEYERKLESGLFDFDEDEDDDSGVLAL